MIEDDAQDSHLRCGNYFSRYRAGQEKVAKNCTGVLRIASHQDLSGASPGRDGGGRFHSILPIKNPPTASSACGSLIKVYGEISAICLDGDDEAIWNSNEFPSLCISGDFDCDGRGWRICRLDIHTRSNREGPGRWVIEFEGAMTGGFTGGELISRNLTGQIEEGFTVWSGGAIGVDNRDGRVANALDDQD